MFLGAGNWLPKTSRNVQVRGRRLAKGSREVEECYAQYSEEFAEGGIAKMGIKNSVQSMNAAAKSKDVLMKGRFC